MKDQPINHSLHDSISDILVDFYKDKKIKLFIMEKLSRYEFIRLLTFNGWPGCTSPNELAKTGFFYLKTGDVVMCFECGLVVNAWEPTDIPFTEHKKMNPECNFIKGLEVGNIPLNIDINDDVVEISTDSDDDIVKVVIDV